MTNHVRYHGEFATVGINLGVFRKVHSYTALSGDVTVDLRFEHGPLLLDEGEALRVLNGLAVALGSDRVGLDVSGIAAHLEEA